MKKVPLFKSTTNTFALFIGFALLNFFGLFSCSKPSGNAEENIIKSNTLVSLLRPTKLPGGVVMPVGTKIYYNLDRQAVISLPDGYFMRVGMPDTIIYITSTDEITFSCPCNKLVKPTSVDTNTVISDLDSSQCGITGTIGGDVDTLRCLFPPTCIGRCEPLLTIKPKKQEPILIDIMKTSLTIIRQSDL